MTPQSHFVVVAPVEPGREAALRDLLETLNGRPGLADPENALVPFGQFEGLHFARLVILDDPTLGDMALYGLPAPSLPVYLAFLGDFDGPDRDFLAELAERAGQGLRTIFRHCRGFDEKTDLLAWLRAHQRTVAAPYVHWVGRTVRQIREESALQQALADQVRRAPVAPDSGPQQRRADLQAFVRQEVAAGRLTLTPPAPTPTGWQFRELLNGVGVPLIGLATLPLALPLLPFAAFYLRRLEKTDPEYCPRPDPAALLELKRLEDQDVTNQYTAFGLVKPGLFRRWLLTLVLTVVNYTARHWFNRGHLARVQTIHFAHWIFLDDKARVFFVSNYDGLHEAYMDDFINKVAFGLNVVFGNGVGWPHLDWMLKRGARREMQFKYYQRRHQLPTQVWYKAYPGLALSDLRRNQTIRQGLERPAMTDAEALAWLRLL